MNRIITPNPFIEFVNSYGETNVCRIGKIATESEADAPQEIFRDSANDLWPVVTCWYDNLLKQKLTHVAATLAAYSHTQSKSRRDIVTPIQAGKGRRNMAVMRNLKGCQFYSVYHTMHLRINNLDRLMSGSFRQHPIFHNDCFESFFDSHLLSTAGSS